MFGIYPKRRPTEEELAVWSATFHKSTQRKDVDTIYKNMVNLAPNGIEFTIDDAQRMVNIQRDYESEYEQWLEELDNNRYGTGEPKLPEPAKWLLDILNNY